MDFSILPVAANEEGREEEPADQYLTLSLESPAKFCGFLILFTVYMTPGLLMTNGGPRSQKGKRFFSGINRVYGESIKLGLRGTYYR